MEVFPANNYGDYGYGFTGIPEVLDNPETEEDEYQPAQDYQVYDITGWTATTPSGVINAGHSHGLTGAAPFLNNGAIPDGGAVAFLQGDMTLSQVLTGFETDAIYWVQGFYNARNMGELNGKPALTVRLGGGDPLIESSVISPSSVDDPFSPFYFLNLSWAATNVSSSDSVSFSITAVPTEHPDTTLLFDGISIIKRTLSDIVIANPSFEASGVIIPTYYDPEHPENPRHGTDFGYTKTTAGWTLYGFTGINKFGDIFHAGISGTVPDGGNFLLLQNNEFFGETSTSARQVLTGLIVDQDYVLSLDYSSRITEGSVSPIALFTISGDSGGSQWEISDITGPDENGNFIHVEYTFTAMDSTVSLILQNIRDYGDSTLFIDNVRVYHIPEPGSLMLLSLGGGLFLLRRRRMGIGC